MASYKTEGHDYAVKSFDLLYFNYLRVAFD
jgi:hypothetical protein